MNASRIPDKQSNITNIMRFNVVRGLQSSLDRVQLIFLALALARFIIALLFMLNILPLGLRYKWFLHHGGDQEYALELAYSIISGHPVSSVVGIGQPLVMIPWIILLRPYTYLDLVAPLVVINGFIWGTLSVLIIGGIARQMLQNDRVAVIAAAIWAFLPLLAYGAFFWHHDPVTLYSAAVPTVGWLNGLADGPAVFFLLVALLLLTREIRSEQTGFGSMVGVGAALSVAVMFRIHVASMVSVLLLYVLLAHGWQALLAAGAGGLITYLPQAWYNLVVFGIPFTTGYISYGDILNWGGLFHRPLQDIVTSTIFHPRNVIDTFRYFLERRFWLLIPIILVIAIMLWAIIVLWRRKGWRAVILLIVAPLVYLGPMMLAWNFRDDVVRFTLPAVPVVMIAVIYLSDVFVQNLRSRSAARP